MILPFRARLRSRSLAGRVEVWAGVECTVNRVGGRYFDQLARTGHADRVEDIDRLASLGVRTVRYPVLWERTAPGSLDRADWSWADERLGRLRALGITPVVGLVHHGSGPRSTDLLDPAFPTKLARYARAVAERYPWVEMYTPINEPLTTARFAALYGLWYPHRRDPRSFAVAFLNQCRAVRLAMQAIRDVNPAARLVQTEDMGKVHGTPRLGYQVAFENVRRWLTFDALGGRMTTRHPMWRHFRWAGVDDQAIAAAVEEPCVPDIIGINYYLTSERFLDERLDRYPAHTHGTNGRHTYADVEAVRVRAEGVSGPEAILREAWERYRTPLAVTEVHLGCTREEQLRWLDEVWCAATALRADGCDVRAVTTWSAFGAYDWASLLTREEGSYEPGAFDVRAPEPRPTAVAAMVRSLATTGSYGHPALHGSSWWSDKRRLSYPAVRCPGRNARRRSAARPEGRPLLITGASGTLGRALARVCDERGLPYCLTSRRELDIADPASVETALAAIAPWAVVNAAGYVRVDDAEADQDRCYRENAHGSAVLAAACVRARSLFATFSSDLVFDGRAARPYLEGEPVAPLNVYGASKVEAERRVRELLPSALIVRTSAFFGPWDDYNFVAQTVRALSARLPSVAANDAVVSPTYVPDLAHATLDLLIDGESGIWHLANQGAVTWAELAFDVAERCGLDSTLVDDRPTALLGLAAPRPLYSVLGSRRGVVLPSLENALGRYFEASDHAGRQADAEQYRITQTADAGGVG